MSISLNLIAAASFLPCLAMEKEKPLTDVDKTLLKAADENNCPNVIEALKNGANVNAQDQDKNTALHKAIQRGNYELFQALCNGQIDPLLYDGQLDPHIKNRYGFHPIFYLDDKIKFLHQFNIIAFTINKAIYNQALDKLATTKNIRNNKFDLIKNRNEIINLFNTTIGKKQKSFHCPFYNHFLYEVCDYIQLALLALEDHPDKKAYLINLDPLLPYFDLKLAQKKVSHLLQILKIINTIAFTPLNKPLDTISIFKDEDWFGQLKNHQETVLISLYGMQVKTIVDNPIKYVNEIKQKLTHAQAEEKHHHLALTFTSIVTLLQNGLHLRNTPDDEQRMRVIVDTAPASDIKSEQFALAFTTFARLRK